MRLLRQLVAAILLAAFGQSLAAAQAPPPSSPLPTEPLRSATRQNAFTIPFEINPPASPAEKPVEAILNSSTDQGATWSIASRVKPEKASFVFRAPHDGEYWFNIRTLDAQGVTRPSGPIQPMLIVTVDTVAPRLDLSVVRGPAGEIVARWQAVDPNLNLNSFKLEYQVSSAGPWEKVAVDSPPSAMQHTHSGEATWWPTGATGPVLVRAEISDASGNPAVTQAVAKASTMSGAPTLAKQPQPTLATPPGARTESADGWRANASASDRTTWQPDRMAPDPLVAPRSGSASVPANTAAQPSNLPPDAYSGPAPAGFPAGFPDAPPPAAANRTTAQPISQSRPAVSPSRGSSSLDFSVLPAAVRPRMVASPAFELEYEIESVGPSGVGKIELWGTRDGGHTWSDYAVDADKRSPMAVNVDGEGIYGFRILVQSGTGFGGHPPVEGDLPDVWIGVDLTKPTCRITGTEVSPDGTQLLIYWEAADDAIDPRPVTLLFSESANGPWTPIASGLENTGSYQWSLDSRVPARVFLRIEVRDEAGNIGSQVQAEAISLDRNRPQGKIRGVRAINTP
jgi:hypothetical protein